MQLFIRHLNGTVLESFVRPAVLITDAYNALNTQPPRRQRDHEFLGPFLSFILALSFSLYMYGICDVRICMHMLMGIACIYKNNNTYNVLQG